MPKILHLTLMRKWFIQILEGKKKIEYREIKPYWTKRLFENGIPVKYDYISFKNGYPKDAPEMKVEFLGVKITDKYEILLGRVLEQRNVQGLV